MQLKAYPLKCAPLLKEKLWGGYELRDYLKKSSYQQQIGESWEIADLPEDSSTIANGIYKGKSLRELLSAFAKAILGPSIAEKYGATMPLLIKYIDASDKLSVQLHPDNELAKDTEQGTGKTEMWYILKATNDAHIIAGFKEGITPAQFEKALENDQIEKHLNFIPVKAGDAFYIRAGLIHAIGAGIVLAEIQQPSDITYRVYDYHRKQKNGKYRDLHIEEAKKAIKYYKTQDVNLLYDTTIEGKQTLKHSPFFKTDIVQVYTTSYIIDREACFTVIMVVEGKGHLACEGNEYALCLGDTYLIPASCSISTITGDKLKFLEVYL